MAKLNIGITAMYESTLQFCHEYIQNETDKCDFSVEISDDDIDIERNRFATNALFEGLERKAYPEELFEQTSIYRKIAEQLPYYCAAVCHASSYAIDERGVLILAKSGMGKSTHVRLCKSISGDNFQYINDDKPIVRIIDNIPMVCGSPWSGKHHLDNNITVPLVSLGLFNRGNDNSCTLLPKDTAFPFVFQYFYRPNSSEAMELSLKLVDRLVKEIPIYHIYCNMKTDAAIMSMEHLLGGKD